MACKGSARWGESSAPVAVKVPVDGGTTDANGLGDRGNRVLPRAVHLLGHLSLVGRHGRGPAPVATPGPSGGQSRGRVLADRVAFDSANAAKMWKTSLPPVVVSIAS